MTRDEILAMEAGPELDALVEREVMGREWTCHTGVFINGRWQQMGTWLRSGESRVDLFPGTMAGQTPPRRSTDIAPAWEVLEKVTAIPTVNARFVHLWQDAQVWAMGEREAATFICRAALLAVMEE